MIYQSVQRKSEFLGQPDYNQGKFRVNQEIAFVGGVP